MLLLICLSLFAYRILRNKNKKSDTIKGIALHLNMNIYSKIVQRVM